MATQQEHDSTVLATWRRPDGETRLSLTTYKGKQYVDFRQFWTPDGEDESRPTKKGVALHIEAIPELIAGLVEAAMQCGIKLAKKADTE